MISRVSKYLVAVAAVGGVVVALRLASVDSAGIAAPLLLLDIVVVARFFGTGPALVGAAEAAAAYSYYFLPPAGFAIADPDDWVAFVTFVVTAILAGELASRAERRALEAQEGRREIERLYQELQAAFDRASEAEAARRNEELKAALLDALTHNLRTPLTAIKAAVTALLGASDGIVSRLPAEDQGELLQVIDEESDRLNRFIEALSSADRRDAESVPQLRSVPAESVVRASLQRAETVTRDHRVRTRLEPNLPPLAVESASIAEAIYILVDNASKYAPPATTITVEGRQCDADNVQITVTDEGPGIAEEHRDRVFEKFYRIAGREPHDVRRGGVGLGLPIARRLVEAQGGRISILTPPSRQGTTVAIILPIATQKAAGEPPVAAATASN